LAISLLKQSSANDLRHSLKGRFWRSALKGRARLTTWQRLAATPLTSSLPEVATLFLVKTRWTVLLQKRPNLGLAPWSRMTCSVQPAFQGIGQNAHHLRYPIFAEPRLLDKRSQRFESSLHIRAIHFLASGTADDSKLAVLKERKMAMLLKVL
jgi:hypothetical protein